MKNNTYKLKTHFTKQLSFNNKYILPASFSLILEKNNNWFDTFSLTLYLPRIYDGYDMDDGFNDDLKFYGLKFPTEIVFSKNTDYLGLKIKILGFGITIARQWSY